MYLILMLLIGVTWGIVDKIKIKKRIKENYKINCIKVKRVGILYSVAILSIGCRISTKYIENINGLIKLILIATLILLVWFMIVNKRLEFNVVGLGFILNLIAMIANNGRMPVATTMLNKLDSRHIVLTSTSHLKWLSDIICLPYPLNIGMYISSIGDLIVGAGIVLLTRNLIKYNYK